MKLEKILVPLDGSPLAEAALAPAIELADFSGARLFLLRAAQAHTLPGVDPTEAEVKVVRMQMKVRCPGCGSEDVEALMQHLVARIAKKS